MRTRAPSLSATSLIARVRTVRERAGPPGAMTASAGVWPAADRDGSPSRGAGGSHRHARPERGEPHVSRASSGMMRPCRRRVLARHEPDQRPWVCSRPVQSMLDRRPASRGCRSTAWRRVMGTVQENARRPADLAQGCAVQRGSPGSSDPGVPRGRCRAVRSCISSRLVRTWLCLVLPGRAYGECWRGRSPDDRRG
jgi:hypothetical protein